MGSELRHVYLGSAGQAQNTAAHGTSLPLALLVAPKCMERRKLAGCSCSPPTKERPPVRPTMPIFSPPCIRKEMPLRTGSRSGLYRTCRHACVLSLCRLWCCMACEPDTPSGSVTALTCTCKDICGRLRRVCRLLCCRALLSNPGKRYPNLQTPICICRRLASKTLGSLPLQEHMCQVTLGGFQAVQDITLGCKNRMGRNAASTYLHTYGAAPTGRSHRGGGLV